MTITDEQKILDDKIKVNQVRYDLDREAGKISAHYHLKRWISIFVWSRFRM